MAFVNSQVRVQLNAWLEGTAVKLNLQGKKILEIGIAGDEKPSGSYKFFGRGNEWKTLDKNPKWKPDFVDDITDSGLPDNSYDLVIMTQTLEHIWHYKTALCEICRITKKYAIIDCPFFAEFHQDLARANDPWEKWDDYWRFTPAAFRKLLLEVGFEKVDLTFNNLLTFTLCEKSLSQAEQVM